MRSEQLIDLREIQNFLSYKDRIFTRCSPTLPVAPVISSVLILVPIYKLRYYMTSKWERTEVKTGHEVYSNKNSPHSEYIL
jgi:hypothetical protein